MSFLHIFHLSHVYVHHSCSVPLRPIDFDDGKHRNFDYYSPTRDPAAMRNHYEGLLEGAIQMYSSQDDLPMPLPNRDFTNNRKPTKRELRGSSAGASK